MGIFRRINHVIMLPPMWLAMHLKMFAYRQPFYWLRHVILEVTQFFDFLMVLANVQNHAVRINHSLFKRGNFLFGKAVMVVDYDTSVAMIPGIQMRGSRFMGVPMVANDPAVFVLNAGPITTSQPARKILRQTMNQEIITEQMRNPSFAWLTEQCAQICAEWKADKNMASMWGIRGTSARIVAQLIGGIDVPHAQAQEITKSYFMRFGEMTLFSYYATPILGILNTKERIRRNAFQPLQDLGVSNMVIDMVLFAGMFSLGTIIIKCIENTRTHNIDYMRLSFAEKRRFVIESQRLFPTVTSVHRILEKEETVIVRGKTLKLRPGDEVAYPFLPINQDPKHFSLPKEFRLDRPEEEIEKVLSWSTGFHACPFKELSILITILQLDTLAEQADLRTVSFFNLEV